MERQLWMMRDGLLWFMDKGSVLLVIGKVQHTHMHAKQTLHSSLTVWSFVNGMHSNSHEHHTESLVVRHETTQEGAHMDRC